MNGLCCCDYRSYHTRWPYAIVQQQSAWLAAGPSWAATGEMVALLQLSVMTYTLAMRFCKDAEFMTCCKALVGSYR